MTHVAKFDILTGLEEIGKLILKVIFIAYLSKKHAFSQNLFICAINYESIAYCLTKFH